MISGKSRKQLLRIVEGWLSPDHIAQPESRLRHPCAGERGSARQRRHAAGV